LRTNVKTRIVFVLAIPLLMAGGVALPVVINQIPTASAAAPQGSAPDMILLDQESKFEREKTQYLQENILDKILGPGKAVVIVDVEMGLETRSSEMEMGKKKNDKKKNEGDDSNNGPAAPPKFLVPGVPMPKSVVQYEEDRGGETKETGGSMAQKHLEVRTTIKKLLITVLYDKRVPSDKLQAVKQAIIALMKVTDAQLVFTPTVFTETVWEQVLTPKWIIPISLAIWLLLFLWGPVASFFRRLNRALEDKSQHITQELKSKAENESSEQAEEEGDAGGGGGGGAGEGGELTEEEKKEGEEDMKKFEPFKYVNEENLKRLAYLIRKEEPWIIALVLSYLKPEFAKEVLGSMPPELQARVAVETATIRQTSLEQVMSIDEYIKKKIDFVLGGLENLLKILDEADKTTRETILEYLKNEKPQLYERVREEVVLFEDLLKFPDVAIQVIVREVGTESLSRALRGASPDYMNKFFINMSAGAAALLKESMDYGRPLTPDQVDEERKNLMDVISKAERDGKITIRKKRKTSMLEGEEASDEAPSLHLGQSSSKPASAAVTEEDIQRSAEFFQTGMTYYQQGQYPEAVQNFHYALQAQPNQWQIYQYLGAAYYAQNMYTQAMGAYERMIELNPEDEALRTWVTQFKAQIGAVTQGGPR
jgi:flagellar motor switch protein FliG